jgi:5'-nucleotidase
MLKILLTNDDGYRAEGLKQIYRELAGCYDVVVAAPETEQSGTGHAFTYTSAVRCAEIPEKYGLNGFAVEGTPADCVKLAMAQLLQCRPDLVVSGINAGENAGLAGHYSGTVAGAREACFWGVPAVAFSCSSDGNGGYYWGYAHIARLIAEKIADLPLEKPGRRQVFYNVNFPACPPSMCAGIRITRQSMTFFDDRYIKESVNGKYTVYRLDGGRMPVENESDFDARALLQNYATITPVIYDATAHDIMPNLIETFNNLSLTQGAENG